MYVYTYIYIYTQGLLQDYKEAERMPSELLAALFGLTRALRLQHFAVAQRPEDLQLLPAPPTAGGPCRGAWGGVVRAAGESSALALVQEALLAALSVLETAMPAAGYVGRTVRAMERVDAADAAASGLMAACDEALKERGVRGFTVVGPDRHWEAVRSVMARALVIKSTSYILEAYTLMDLMVIIYI
jgi:hypothetical protein